uniref:Uncharacterized protein n=1 Tax=Ananas comosus var. bracteatus TaxID=296719 RepID=A0A6V7NWT0_ANACO|nr:unnamed protein product [Ananas comosus var. bracteatus]
MPLLHKSSSTFLLSTGLPRQISCTGTGPSTGGSVPESFSHRLELPASFPESNALAGHLREPVLHWETCPHRDSSLLTGTDLSPKDGPESITCASRVFCRTPAYGNRSLIPGTGPREHNLQKCMFALFALVDFNSNALFRF